MRLTLAAALMCLGCAGSPGDAFVGRWAVVYECRGSFDNGDLYEEGPAEQTIRIDRGVDGELFLAAVCSFPLRVESATRLAFEPYACETTLPLGQPITQTIDRGVIDVDEPRIAYAFESTLDAPEGDPTRGPYVLRISCTAEGERAD